MKRGLGLASVALAMGLASAAGAQTLPDQLVSGSVTLAIASTTLRAACYVNHTTSLFQRNGTGRALITFDEITEGGTDLSGAAVLSFSSATSGQIHFTQFPGLSDPAFINYTQVYNPTSQAVAISFTISFPDCALPIHAVYNLT